jgi:hypothetical protein
MYDGSERRLGMERIQRISGILLKLFQGMLVALPFEKALFWLLIDWMLVKQLMQKGIWMHAVLMPEGFKSFADIQLNALSKWIGFAGSVMGSLPLWMGLVVLIKLFRNYQAGRIFASINVVCYRQLGWLCFINALVVRPLNEMIMTLAATLSNPPGQRMISIGWYA